MSACPAWYTASAMRWTSPWFACALCACSVSSGTSDVRSIVVARVRHPIAIEPGGANANADADSVQKLLAQPLDAERAVAIALLQNPRVAAALAELGVARSDVLAA